MTPEEVKRIIKEELGMFIKNERFTFYKTLQIMDGINVQTGTTTGTKFGLDATNKIGFFGVTPVDRPETISSTSTGSLVGGDTVNLGMIEAEFTEKDNAINALISRLKELGLIK